MESKMKHNTVDLTYEMICKALDGDESAEEQIFNHYEPYIIMNTAVRLNTSAVEN